tara:strand:+ start:303 stop:866 length:564 start_codon:yes stop_codon:yes gene_type:complete
MGFLFDPYMFSGKKEMQDHINKRLTDKGFQSYETWEELMAGRFKEFEGVLHSAENRVRPGRLVKQQASQQLDHRMSLSMRGILLNFEFESRQAPKKVQMIMALNQPKTQNDSLARSEAVLEYQIMMMNRKRVFSQQKASDKKKKTEKKEDEIDELKYEAKIAAEIKRQEMEAKKAASSSKRQNKRKS